MLFSYVITIHTWKSAYLLLRFLPDVGISPFPHVLLYRLQTVTSQTRKKWGTEGGDHFAALFPSSLALCLASPLPICLLLQTTPSLLQCSLFPPSSSSSTSSTALPSISFARSSFLLPYCRSPRFVLPLTPHDFCYQFHRFISHFLLLLDVDSCALSRFMLILIS